MKISEVLSLSFVKAETCVYVRGEGFKIPYFGGPDFIMDLLIAANELESFTFEPEENKLYIDVYGR